MQVSAVQAGPPLELFSGFSANHAVLLTPNGLVYVEVPVFADSNTYRRLVSLQASPTAAGGIMRLWQPLPSLPHVQFLEVHCSGEQVPCVLDFRPTGWRIVTTCVEPPVTPTRALASAVDDGLDIPSEWPLTCQAGGFGILHKETAVAASQPLQGGAPFVLLFFPHIFTHEDDSSGHAVGGRASWDKVARSDHTIHSRPLSPDKWARAAAERHPLLMRRLLSKIPCPGQPRLMMWSQVHSSTKGRRGPVLTRTVPMPFDVAFGAFPSVCFAALPLLSDYVCSCLRSMSLLR